MKRKSDDPAAKPVLFNEEIFDPQKKAKPAKTKKSANQKKAATETKTARPDRRLQSPLE